MFSDLISNEMSEILYSKPEETVALCFQINSVSISMKVMLSLLIIELVLLNYHVTANRNPV